MQEPFSSVGTRGVIPAGVIAAQGACALSPVPESGTTFVESIEWLASRVPVVSVIGELDLATTPTLEETASTAQLRGLQRTAR